MSSPIILKRDLTTFTYLANKRNLQGLSLHMLQKTWKLHQQTYARRATILKLITGWDVDGSRYAMYTQDPQAKIISWPIQKNNRSIFFRNCQIYAEPSVPVSATARIANSFGREPGRPT
jgi:hypothetical protein